MSAAVRHCDNRAKVRKKRLSVMSLVRANRPGSVLKAYIETIATKSIFKHYYSLRIKEIPHFICKIY